jgi:hypothetical protein
MTSGRPEPIFIDVDNVFEPPGGRNVRREQTLSKLLDALNELGKQDRGEVDPTGSFYPDHNQSTADSWINYHFSYATDVAQHASFEDDGDVRKLGIKTSAT